jgi:hypothetical protein
VTLLGLRAAANEQASIRAEVNPARVTIAVSSGSERNSEAMRLSPVAGWRNLIPTRGVGRGVQRLFDLVWTLGFGGYLLLAVRLLRSLRLR